MLSNSPRLVAWPVAQVCFHNYTSCLTGKQHLPQYSSDKRIGRPSGVLQASKRQWELTQMAMKRFFKFSSPSPTNATQHVVSILKIKEIQTKPGKDNVCHLQNWKLFGIKILENQEFQNSCPLNEFPTHHCNKWDGSWCMIINCNKIDHKCCSTHKKRKQHST